MQLYSPNFPGADGYIGGMDLIRYAELDKPSVARHGRHYEYAFRSDEMVATEVDLAGLVSQAAVRCAGVGNVQHFIGLGKSRLARRVAVVGVGQAKSADADPAWLAHVNDSEASTSIKSLTATINTLLAQLRERGPDSIELARVARTAPNAEHLVTILRSLYAWRDRVAGWDDLQSFARRNLAERGFDAAALMRGLDR